MNGKLDCSIVIEVVVVRLARASVVVRARVLARSTLA